MLLGFVGFADLIWNIIDLNNSIKDWQNWTIAHQTPQPDFNSTVGWMIWIWVINFLISAFFIVVGYFGWKEYRNNKKNQSQSD
jgi:hypothetical protein